MTYSVLEERASERGSLISQRTCTNYTPSPSLSATLTAVSGTYPGPTAWHTSSAHNRRGRIMKGVHATQHYFPPTRTLHNCMQPSHPPPRSRPNCSKHTNRHAQHRRNFLQLDHQLDMTFLYAAEDTSLGFCSRLMTAGRASPSFRSWLITNIINVASDVLGRG